MYLTLSFVIALAANFIAVTSGWLVLFGSPTLIASLQKRNFSLEPRYMAYVLIVLTTGQSLMFLLLIAKWLIVSKTRAVPVDALALSMIYHAMAGGVVTLVHVFVAQVLKYLPQPRGSEMDRGENVVTMAGVAPTARRQAHRAF